MVLVDCKGSRLSTPKKFSNHSFLSQNINIYSFIHIFKHQYVGSTLKDREMNSTAFLMNLSFSKRDKAKNVIQCRG